MPTLKKTKKIALIIRLLPNRSGGAERLYCELANMLSEHGHDVTCIYYDDATGDPFYKLNKPVKVINLNSNKKNRRSSYHLSPRLKRYYKILVEMLLINKLNKILWESINGNFIEKLREYFVDERIDLAISFMPTANTVTVLAAKEINTKIIVTNHNVPEQDYASPLRWDPNPYDRKMRLSALEYADAIHVLFPGFASWFPDNLQSKITAIPNYVSDEFNLEKVRDVRKEKTILAVGRLASVKNYPVLVDAWSSIHFKYPDWNVVLYGDGPQLRLLKTKIQELGLEKSFLLKGHKADLSTDYASASIFCHPALFEGFGLSVAEALSFKLPIVAFDDCAGVNEYVKDGLNGLLVPRSGGSAALTQGLEKLIEDEAKRLELGYNGPMSISEYTREKYFSNWCSLIEKVADDHG